LLYCGTLNLMSTPTHRVTKLLSAGDFDYKVNELVDASNWANLQALVSTDYLVKLSSDEIAELTATVEPEEAPVVKTVPVKKAPSKKPVAKKTTR